jgi:hypothetical protein
VSTSVPVTLTADEPGDLATLADQGGHGELSRLLEDLADRAAARESLTEPGEDIPDEQALGQSGASSDTGAALHLTPRTRRNRP